MEEFTFPRCHGESGLLEKAEASEMRGAQSRRMMVTLTCPGLAKRKECERDVQSPSATLDL